MSELTDRRPSTVFVDELFDELLDYPSSLREEMLVHRCDDPSLQQEVRALLDAADALPAPILRSLRKPCAGWGPVWRCVIPKPRPLRT